MPSASHPRPEDPRAALLRAAIAEIAEKGEAGARTDAIAKAAGVNKALLHYYFGTKEGLHAAVLDAVTAGLLEAYLTVLEGPGTPGERMLRYLLASFDRMASTHAYARVLGQEMMQARAGQSASIARLVEVYFRPLNLAIGRTLGEGMACGEFLPSNPSQTSLSLQGANIFYFQTTPVFREMTGRDPRDPELVALRRTAFLDMAALVLFADREAGRALARTLCREPIPVPSPTELGS
jgi:TetR/AcrR family transcriptional regulator